MGLNLVRCRWDKKVVGGSIWQPWPFKRGRWVKKVIRFLVKKVHPRRENPGNAHAGRPRLVRLRQRNTILDQSELLLFYELNTQSVAWLASPALEQASWTCMLPNSYDSDRATYSVSPPKISKCSYALSWPLRSTCLESRNAKTRAKYVTEGFA